jgi:hypothetical protein
MAFHLDCKGRHGLVSIDRRPAAYPGWECDTCKQQIKDNCVGVLHCAICTVDICPACWTRLLPKIENASGYPCFWCEEFVLHGQRHSRHTPRSESSILVCHRPGPDGLKCGDFQSSQRYQCCECSTLTHRLQSPPPPPPPLPTSLALPSGTSVAPVAPPDPGALPAGWHETKDVSGRSYYTRVENGRIIIPVQWERPNASVRPSPPVTACSFMLSETSGRGFGTFNGLGGL